MNKAQTPDTLFLCKVHVLEECVASSRKHVRLTFDVHFGSLEDKGGSSEGFRVFESTSCRQDPHLLTSMA